MTKQNNVKRTTFFLMIIYFLSRILGFIREMIIAKVFGRNSVTDAFFAAFTIPDVMYDLLVAGALSSGFMPVFNEHLAKEDEEGAWKAANTFITVALIFIVIFNILYYALAKYLIPLVAIGNAKDPATYALTVKLTRFMTISVSFTVCAGLTMGILNSYKIFTTPALGPVLYNVGIIIGAILLGGKFGIYGLATGVILGALLNFGVQVPNFLKVGKRFRFELNTKNESYRRMLRLMGPALLGLAILRINLVVNQNIASILDQGSITALRYAQRIMMLPVGIFGASVSTAIFPTLNAHIARKEFDEYKAVISQGLRTLIFITIPATVGLVVLNKPIVRLLFKTGKFTEQDVLVTAFALSFYALGILGQCAVPVLTRSFYSLQDTKTPVKIGALIVVFNITLNLLFVKFSGLAIGGIALTSSLAAILQMVLLYRMLGKKVNGLRTREVIVSLTKSIAASVAMGVVVFLSSLVVEKFIGSVSKLAQLINVGISITLGVLVYGLAAYLFKMEELHDAVNIIKKKRKRA
ncbi:murein biosynthesis integral membrane protein MurJ [Thermobrachium celere]|uniref:Probable lipid II flippase MurJ n=1 Tax=Thermobrachium celere DSM 8682 TaxID=941824 RepID=R7RR26_9CLOT|nr:murein biosynthesis integral membrane protein MurJ [Thermobrachium celere]CDF57753.1 Proposed peptidoglycan lipid II flippase MurJ [Thermobrachium celere DSM 8682]